MSGQGVSEDCMASFGFGATKCVLAGEMKYICWRWFIYSCCSQQYSIVLRLNSIPSTVHILSLLSDPVLYTILLCTTLDQKVRLCQYRAAHIVLGAALY